MPSKKIIIKCPECGVVFHRSPHSIKLAIKNSGVWMCKSCSVILRNKEKAKPLGYRSLHKGRGRMRIKTEHGWKFEHVHNMECFLGRFLEDNEIVHHCDGNIKNDDIDNLELMLHGEHTTLHHTGLNRSDSTKEKIRMKAKGRPNKYRSLTYEIANKIRKLKKTNKYKYKKLAKMFNTTVAIVNMIVNNRTYNQKER